VKTDSSSLREGIGREVKGGDGRGRERTGEDGRGGEGGARLNHRLMINQNDDQ